MWKFFVLAIPFSNIYSYVLTTILFSDEVMCVCVCFMMCVCVFEDFVICGCFSGFCNVWVIYNVCVGVLCVCAFEDFVMCVWVFYDVCVFLRFF